MTETKTTPFLKRIAEFKKEFHKQKIEMTGKNVHMEFAFFQIQDFIAIATDLLEKHDLHFDINFPFVESRGERVCLGTCYDVLCPENTKVYEIDLEPAAIPKAQAIQNLGGTITYLRRYMWQIFLDLTENNVVDLTSDGKSDGKSTRKPKTKKTTPASVPESTPTASTPRTEEPNPTDNYRKHFMKEVAKTSMEKDLRESVRSAWGKEFEEMSIPEMKDFLGQVAAGYPQFKIEV